MEDAFPPLFIEFCGRKTRKKLDDSKPEFTKERFLEFTKPSYRERFYPEGSGGPRHILGAHLASTWKSRARRLNRKN